MSSAQCLKRYYGDHYGRSKSANRLTRNPSQTGGLLVRHSTLPGFVSGARSPVWKQSTSMFETHGFAKGASLLRPAILRLSVPVSWASRLFACSRSALTQQLGQPTIDADLPSIVSHGQ